ncbi:hypothetical protein [Nocardia sp. CA-145437]|uniref:hypothetical protein n=1 Tax=Nocardia sp. CA-145437 TaxID=3239980 RepID=UPI003D9723C9
MTLVNMQPDAIAAAWRGGDIDAAFVWEPTLSELVKNGHVVTTAAETAKAGKPTYLDAAAQAGPAYLGEQLGADLKASAEFLLSQGEIQGLAAPEAYAGAVYAAAATKVSAK